MARLIDGTRRHIGTILGRIYEEAQARVSVRYRQWLAHRVPLLLARWQRTGAVL